MSESAGSALVATTSSDIGIDRADFICDKFAGLSIFFIESGVFLFALRVLPWHWLYYFYSGMAFVVGVLRHQIRVIKFEAIG